MSGRWKPFSIGICRCCYWKILLVRVISVDNELFGNKDGIGLETSTNYSPDSFLARVKYQTEEHHTTRQETQQLVAQGSLNNQGKFFTLCTSDNDMHQQTVLSDLSCKDPFETQHFPLVSPTGENCQSTPPQESNAKDDASITPVVRPTLQEKHCSKEVDNVIGNDQEEGHKTRVRSAKWHETARSKPQAKPKPKPKLVNLSSYFWSSVLPFLLQHQC